VIFSLILARNRQSGADRRTVETPGVGEQDRVFKIGSSILTVLVLVVAGLDVGRCHWTGSAAPWLPIAALVIVLSARGGLL
jgi:hypothetical protein